MSAIAGMSRRRFFYNFKNFTGHSPHHFFRYMRLRMVRQGLLTKNYSVTEMAAKFHFHQLGGFSKLYKNTYGELPSQTQKCMSKGVGDK